MTRRIRLVDRDTLELTMQRGKLLLRCIDASGERDVEDDGTKTRKPTLAGVWKLDLPEEGLSAELRLGEDGRFTRSWTEDGETTRARGKWGAADGVLVIEDSEEGTLRIPFELRSPDEVVLTIEGESVLFVREGGKARLPAGLAGAWSARDPTGSFRVVLDPTMTFELDMSNVQQRFRFEGEIRPQPGVLLLADPRQGRTIALSWKLLGADRLQVQVGDGQTIVLTKER